MTFRPRNVALERHFTEIAARAAALPGAQHTLDAFADQRAWPGGVREDLDSDRETAEELADARHYLVWGLVPLYERAAAGDPAVLDAYERRLRALSHVIAAWHALHTDAA